MKIDDFEGKDGRKLNVKEDVIVGEVTNSTTITTLKRRNIC
jgi:hypothetical protein